MTGRRRDTLVAAFVGNGFGENRREAMARARQNALYLARTAGYPSISCEVVLSGCAEPVTRVVAAYVVLGCRQPSAVARMPRSA
ncbi:putative GNAT superfamily acetyltransferase [Crossiella equi]|uniref:GNAT superfamily acetyltransferase n=1 Tax=Crossiella equi TaxID=130796 RepID=A0ABS5AK20_9PSEU|nr:hypothetical protein [Crossiella equi]MBP2476727.1 putative GNAT superfamily acetyltransferase [Crossiella equi]